MVLINNKIACARYLSYFKTPYEFWRLILTGTASASWIFLLCGIVIKIFMHFWSASEERWYLEKYGNTSREYFDKTLQWKGKTEIKKKKMSYETSFLSIVCSGFSATEKVGLGLNI